MHTISTKLITQLGFPFFFPPISFLSPSAAETSLTEALSAPNLFDRSSVCAKPLSAKPLPQPSSLSSSLTEALSAPILSAQNLLSGKPLCQRRLCQPPLLSKPPPLSIAAITDSAQQFAATSSFYLALFLSVSSSCRSAGNLWSRLELPAAVLPLSELYRGEAQSDSFWEGTNGASQHHSKN
ncbi:hypothetical protein Pyn_16731 [Prunus yedoensis var. nudiflora]|uniref:Uncharacterized protein n=1 Tax=Prunus yedoensis var. nudiflora TaxID=2094558 RepID=A0A314U7I2_PRUYE|nr:hypothetical protein Pyn_16731 [Prunus yedoensis var. nudiflora]